MAVTSSTIFRTLSRSVSGLLTSISEHGESIASNADIAVVILIVALRILESRKRLHLLGESELTHMTAPKLLEKLHELNQQSCPSELAIELPVSLPLVHKDHLKHLQEPKLEELWLEDGALGFAYQFLCKDSRKSVQAQIQSANKELTAQQIIAFTQLYTPGWVVDFLLANSALPQWESTEAQINQFSKWLLPQQTTGWKPTEDISILDPACGAGNFLVRAAGLCFQMYSSQGYNPAQAISKLQNHNIFGADIDPMALWVSSLALLIKCLELSDTIPLQKFNLSLATTYSASDEVTLLGSLYRGVPKDHVLSRKYSVVVTNPPYIGRKLMSRELKSAIKANYPNSSHDIAAAFVERSIELLHDDGRFGVITQASVLSLPSYGALRKMILEKHTLLSSVNLGSGVFPMQGGDKVNSVLLLIGKNANEQSAPSFFLDVVQSTDKRRSTLDEIALLSKGLPGTFKLHKQQIFLAQHKHAINSTCPESILRICSEARTVGDIAEIRQGLATSDNDRFVKLIDDIDPELIGSQWIPYVKGAGGNRWFSPVQHAVKWSDNGREIKAAVAKAYPYLNGNIKWVVKNEQFYFRPGLCFSFVNTKDLAVRKLPGGCIFDVAASAVFPHESADEDFLLAYLNSSLISAIAKSINPTVNIQVGDLKRLPLFSFDDHQKRKLADIARRCCELSMQVHELRRNGRTGPDGTELKIKRLGEQISALEAENNLLVLNVLLESGQFSDPDKDEIENWLKLKPARV